MTIMGEMARAARERRLRLVSPANGFHSSELEVVSRREFRERQQARRQLHEAKLRKLDRLRDRFRARKAKQELSTVIHLVPQGEPPLLDTAERVFTIRDIARAVCDHFHVTMVDLVSKRRTARIVRPRQVVMFLARAHTTRSLPEIGRLLGDKDHTTVLHGVRSIADRLAADPALHRDIDEIVLRLGIRS
jgi:chromosomal replication initiation ATPase DnaA